MAGGVSSGASGSAPTMIVMVAVAVVCLPIFFTGMRISRAEGALFLGYYLAYMAYLFLAAGHHEALPAFGRVMVLVVLPLTLLALILGLWRGRKRSRG